MKKQPWIKKNDELILRIPTFYCNNLAVDQIVKRYIISYNTIFNYYIFISRFRIIVNSYNLFYYLYIMFNKIVFCKNILLFYTSLLKSF